MLFWGLRGARGGGFNLRDLQRIILIKNFKDYEL
jgi:hypothetical protein